MWRRIGGGKPFYTGARGTRYASTRRVGGLYRSSSRYVLTGRARRVFRGRGNFKKALRSVAEKKYWDFGSGYRPGVIAETPVTDAGVFHEITAVPQGQEVIARIGDKTTGSSIEINYTIQSFKGGLINPISTLFIRFTIFIWKDDTMPTVPDINENAYAATLGVFAPIAPLNHDRKVKRKILYDKVHTLHTYWNVTDEYSVFVPAITKRFSIPLTKLKYGLGTINFYAGSEAGVNKIYLLMQSNVGAADAATRAWQVAVYTRYNFIDM